jgi:hypothetical protein
MQDNVKCGENRPDAVVEKMDQPVYTFKLVLS